MKKKLLILLTLIAIISVVWINKLYLVDDFETYHTILSKVIFVLDKYIYIMIYQLWKQNLKYADWNMTICLIGLAYYLSTIYFLKPVVNSIAVNPIYVFRPGLYFILFAQFYTLKRDKIRRKNAEIDNKYN